MRGSVLLEFLSQEECYGLQPTLLKKIESGALQGKFSDDKMKHDEFRASKTVRQLRPVGRFHRTGVQAKHIFQGGEMWKQFVFGGEIEDLEDKLVF